MSIWKRLTQPLDDLPDDAEIEAQAQKERQQEAQAIWGRCVRRIPARYRHATLREWRISSASRRAAQAAAEAWLDDPNNPAWCLLLSGTVGTGKSYLGTAAFKGYLSQTLQRMVEDGGPLPRPERLAHWVDADTAWEKHLIAMENGPFAAAQDSQSLKHTRLLLVDDLQADKERQCQWLSGLLRARYDKRLPTIITTNWLPKDWRGMDERVFSRLSGAETTRVVLTGDDIRGAGL